jgi:Tfp pilus assembly protein PilX
MRSINHDRSFVLRGGRRQAAKGFALIAALLAISVLAALGMLVFSATTQEVRVSSRTVGERKAFSAAESGTHWLTQNFDPANLGNAVKSGVVVDNTSSGDPRTQYSIASHPSGWVPTTGPVAVPYAGYAMGGGETWGRQRFLARVTGTNTGYNSSVQIDVGIGYGPVDISTMYR